jgi:hypothetical protein
MKGRQQQFAIRKLGDAGFVISGLTQRNPLAGDRAWRQFCTIDDFNRVGGCGAENRICPGADGSGRNCNESGIQKITT